MEEDSLRHSPHKMAAAAEHHLLLQPQPRRATAFRLPGRRRRMLTVRLGGRRGWGWRWRLARAFRQIRVSWVALKYRRALKRLKAFYSDLMRDLAAGAASMEAFQTRLMMEASFAVPIMPVTAGQTHYYFRCAAMRSQENTSGMAFL